ncbi:hypothetical protein [Halostagnicola sp. A56]|uniref:hypothetical protein n=1 Tax=Halostagnicola sp. A56 TaxID=1495067 RepID=UPI0012E25ADA|nr:hypothetical protein [Halostagnicola sp. A56]
MPGQKTCGDGRTATGPSLEGVTRGLEKVRRGLEYGLYRRSSDERTAPSNYRLA